MFAYEKHDIVIPCKVSGQPQPKIYWYKNGQPISTGDYMELVDGENLWILGLIVSDSGFYQCFAENSVGTIQATMQLKVLQQGELG